MHDEGLSRLRPVSGAAILFQRNAEHADYRAPGQCTQACKEEVMAQKEPISALAQNIDELFVKQASRFAFHNDDTQNDYRMQENRLSSLMLDKSLSADKHL